MTQPLKKNAALLVAMTCLLLVSCATVPVPTSDLSLAESKIAQAKAVQADVHAPVELRFAEEKLEKAKYGIEMKDYPAAVAFATGAQLDAELAYVKSLYGAVRTQVIRQAEENARAKQNLLGEEQ